MEFDNRTPTNRAVDAPLSNRPGVPMEENPRPREGAHWTQPPSQTDAPDLPHRPDLPSLTPVYGTAVPPRGISGKLRRLAYSIPDHLPRHWLLLLLADRVDAVESLLGRLAKPKPIAVALGGIAALVGLGLGVRRAVAA